MTAPQTFSAAERAEIASKHWLWPHADDRGRVFCACTKPWPCIFPRLLATIDALEAERDAWRESSELNGQRALSAEAAELEAAGLREALQQAAIYPVYVLIERREFAVCRSCLRFVTEAPSSLGGEPVGHKAGCIVGQALAATQRAREGQG